MTLPRLGLLTSPADPTPLAPLVVSMRRWCVPCADDPSIAAPHAYLAADPAAVGLTDALMGPAPVAVLVESTACIPEVVRQYADVVIVRDRDGAIAFPDRAVIFPRDHVRAAQHPSISPFVRSRWRARLHLPDPMIVRLGVPRPWPLDDADVPATLATCSAAVVRGPWLLTALALGTPVITDAPSSARVGATNNIHLLVSPTTDSDDLAVALAADGPRAAAVGWGGRLLVEEHHDLDAVAVAVLDRLGIGPAAFPAAPLANLDAELSALGTPDGSPVALRALRRAASIAGPADWVDLTGRRR